MEVNRPSQRDSLSEVTHCKKYKEYSSAWIALDAGYKLWPWKMNENAGDGKEEVTLNSPFLQPLEVQVRLTPGLGEPDELWIEERG